jgi:TonB family protein
MSNRNPANPGPARPLPERANLEHLKKEAKQRLKMMRLDDSGATLAAAQLATARQYGFTSWRRLVAYVKALRDKERQVSINLPQAFLDGLKAEEKSDYKTADAHFRQAIAESPTLIIAHYRLGRSLVRQQLYSEAFDAFEGLLKIDPENLLAHYEIGKLDLSPRNYPDELLLEFDPENLLANYKIGKQFLSTQNYADAIAKYRWLSSQSGNPTSDSSDPNYELLPSKPRTGDLARHPAHRAYAAELAQYLLDLVPPEIAEQNHLPASHIHFVAPFRDMPKDQSRKQPVTQVGAQHVESLTPKLGPPNLYPMTANLRPEILDHNRAEYTEIARINRLQGSVRLSVVFDVTGQITNILVVRGLPDGLTRCAIRAAQQFRFQPATIDGLPVNVRGAIELKFKA